ncbi:MAG TPA: hypothetical protein VEH77_13440 [Roseiarcus sp.]|nr:hypothetical protein [Roseiarcus sp.]
MSTVLSRRAALTALGAFVLAPASALAQGGLRLRAVRVDVGPLRASAGDPTAVWMEQSLTAALARSVGPYLVPGDRNGATLIARIAYVYLGTSGGGPNFFNQGQDTVEGDLVVRGPRGASEIPLRAIASYLVNGSNISQPVQWNRARIDALAQAFAGWVPSQLGL